MIKILKERIPDILSGNFILTEQPTFAPSFYPKRNEEDGIIFWDLETDQIYNLIRGVTYPFPGAFTFIDTEKVIIWKSQPFDSRIFNHTIEPGTILKIFKNGDFIVKTGTDSLLVSEYDSPVDLESGMVFNSSNYTYKNPFLYPQ